MADLKSQNPDEVLDVLGRVCPYPLVLTKKKLEKMDSGKLLKVLCDAQASAEDSIPKYCEKQKFECELVKHDDGPKWDIFIKKG
jgi:tRNA 2-thiouridine synthesizing protein A